MDTEAPGVTRGTDRGEAVPHRSPWPRYPWPAGKRSAFCFSVDVDAESPMLWAQRDALPARLNQLELRRYGPRVGLWRVLELLDRFAIKGSFYVPGVVAEMHPEILPAIHGAGHEVGLHGYFHELVPESSDAEFEGALDASLEIIRAQIGIRPRGFRSPAWEMTPGMLAGLKARGIAYDSSLGGFDHPYTIDGMTEVPVQWALDDAVFFRYVGGGLDKGPPLPTAPILSGWRDELAVLHREGGLFMLTIHPWISGRGQRIAFLERMIDGLSEMDGLWVATVGEIADHHARIVGPDAFAVSCDIPAPIAPRRFTGGDKP